MASFIWGRNPNVAYKNPYEHEANRQFISEAKQILDSYFKVLMKQNFKFENSDTSLEKAEWMLLMDSVDALFEAISFLEIKKHRITGRLFRDVIENLDLVDSFHSNTDKSQRKLAKWFEGNFIPHRESRDFIEEKEGKNAKKSRAKLFENLSQFTHRTYIALKQSYSLGAEDKIVYDTEVLGSNDKFLTLPQTISEYLAIIAFLIIEFTKILGRCQFITKDELDECWKGIMDSKSVKQRFVEY